MTGLELLKAPATTAEEIADIISAPCPPVVPTECDRLSCRECWLAWLTTGTAAKEKGPSDKQTAPDEDGLHPNFHRVPAQGGKGSTSRRTDPQSSRASRVWVTMSTYSSR